MTFFEQYPERGKGETDLVIEDDDDLRDFVRETLQCYNYRVLEAENGERALEIFSAQGDEIDLFLSDIIMPRKGGWETLEEIRALKAEVKVFS